MVAKRIGIHELRFEEKDAEIFKIADTKTRLDMLQNYFFPRLEALLQDTVALVQDIYSVNPYERMTVTSRPHHRKNARQNFDYGQVYIGLTGKRRTHRFLTTTRADGTLFSYHLCDLTYTPEPDLPALDSYAIIRPGIWWAVLARDQWTCCSCGRSTQQDSVLLEVDHIIPRSRGGTDALGNLQTLCKRCNIGKSNRDDTDSRRSQRARSE